MLSSIGENLGEVGTIYTAGESSHATAHRREAIPQHLLELRMHVRVEHSVVWPSRGYYSAIKGKELLIRITTWMNLRG